ncbi:GcrA family cell cycle regulator [Mangrovibrevibacter kandeliae]|uniref:GcrA family cell cycle regulator n=1 Tax=Mangrovibrevibacter kandeliae TaxID=2968473 RepID=UPI002118CE96|nr:MULTISPECIES: GcrA family cell cycle regulator [unclassified Aurantimonas]MCQ8783229.1 GcrA family cell cycle regulator [Aurantimonas sp. CSK15Z-1]MCW4116256.1 GcrA family cell cycle regulator [Aurantimonas sp. MSK8Z-1]
MSWTDERVDLLKRLWSEGLSASQIAAQLGGGISRNAVIGKVHRLKLDSRAKAPAAVASAAVKQKPAAAEIRSAEDQQAVEVTRAVAQTVSRPMPRLVGATALKFETVADAVSDIVIETPSAEVVPISRNLTLIQLTERTCKWPLGDPLSEDFRFCGNHSGEGSPYCAYHNRMAFQPASDRRRMR